MSKNTILLLAFLISAGARGQQTQVDSLKHVLVSESKDTIKIILLKKLGGAYRYANKPGSSVLSYKQAFDIAQSINASAYDRRQILGELRYMLYIVGNFPASMKYTFMSLELCDPEKDTVALAHAHLVLGMNYAATGNYRTALDQFFISESFFQKVEHPRYVLESPVCAIQLIGETYLKLNKVDSALFYARQAYTITDTMHDDYQKNLSMRMFGDIYTAKNDHQNALYYYRKFINGFYSGSYHNGEIGQVYLSISKLFNEEGRIDSSLYYAKSALDAAKKYQDEEHLLDAATFLYQLYDKSGNEHEAFSYYRMAPRQKIVWQALKK